MSKVSPESSTNLTVVVTGGSSGLGYECCRQLAAVPEVGKIILTSRSKEKAESVIARLAKETGKDSSMFDFVILVLDDLNSIRKAVETFPDFDRLCLNAGGMGQSKMHEKSGATDAVVINALGHAALVDGLLNAQKIKKGSRVVYIGSEVARTIWSFSGLLPNYCGHFGEKDIDWAISKNYRSCCCGCCPIRSQMGDYKNAKIIGHLHFAQLAKENPDILWVTTSPGAVGGQFGTKAKFPVKQLLSCAPCMFRCLCVTQACGVHASERIGVNRYIDVLMGNNWENGSMPMSSKACGLCFWGARGKMTDNRPLVPYFRNEGLFEETAAAVRKHITGWETAEGLEPSPARQVMD